jgi:hypothetical protein
MKNKLMFLVAIMAMICVSDTYCAQDTVPVISDEQHAENEKNVEHLVVEINEDEEKIDLKKKNKDALENELYSHRKRVAFREKYIDELSGQKDAIKNYKNQNDISLNKVNTEMKKRDNGITATTDGFFANAFLSAPQPDSRSGKAYARADKTTADQKEINRKLAEEHMQYVATAENILLPNLNNVLIRKIITLDNLIASFRQCDCYFGDEYDKCLDEEGITTRQRSKDFPAIFVRRAYAAAYEAAQKEGSPIKDEEEIIKLAALNEITKSSAAKAEEKQEELRKAIARERNTAEDNSTPEIPENK